MLVSQKEDMMNCDNYKTAISAEPAFSDETGHTDSCASCQAFQKEILALNANVAKALELNVPALKMPELPDIDTQDVSSLTARRSVSKVTWFALAATVVLGAFVGLRVTQTDVEYGSLEEQLLAHIDHEPRALAVSSTPVSDARLQWAVPTAVATMSHDGGLITYVQSCTINGETVPHLVIQGEHGPITILLMPNEKISESRRFDGVGVRGVILQVGNGSVAIIGDREETLDRVQKNVLDSVSWST